jgi:hypothetical protein
MLHDRIPDVVQACCWYTLGDHEKYDITAPIAGIVPFII